MADLVGRNIGLWLVALRSPWALAHLAHLGAAAVVAVGAVAAANHQYYVWEAD